MMNQLKQQFAIINRIKCLVKKTGSSFFRRRKDPGISEDIAKKIQKSAYDLSHLKQKDIITPPYLDIAEQLQVDDDQIFRAAVYNLTNIAVNEERYAAEIIKALEDIGINEVLIRAPREVEDGLLGCDAHLLQFCA